MNDDKLLPGIYIPGIPPVLQFAFRLVLWVFQLLGGEGILPWNA